MSRVFVSCSYRDRAVGAELGTLVRSLGHEAVDDLDEARGTAWWNAVVGRIEGCDVFVAVASPAYAEAHSCRLAAKHAAATGLPVVRVDLDERSVADCHPIVAEAPSVPFAPEDPVAVGLLAHALTGLPPDDPTEPEPEPAAAVPAALPPEDAADADDRYDAGDGDDVDDSGGTVSVLEIGAALVMLVVAAALLYVGLSSRGGSDSSTQPVQQQTLTSAASAGPGPGDGSTAGAGTPGPGAAALLAQIETAKSPLLPASSCQAGADKVTCTKPAPNIGTVVLTPYSTPAELYDGYGVVVEELSGAPVPENTGNCSETQSEGELGWNVDKQHSLDFSVSDQAAGGLDAASESAGRVFCTASQQVMRLVWTQDPGLLVTVTGQPSAQVVEWWSEVHLQLACAGGLEGSGCTEAE